MRILFCNKYNYPFSGTESYIFDAMELLRAKGHEAALFAMANERGEPTPYDRHFVSHTNFKSQSGWLQHARLAAHAVYSSEARQKIRAMIAEFRPDVAHVRNIYHHLSPSILWELKAQGVPILYHVNDFKLLCPSYNLVREGNACEACKGGRFRHMLKTACYPGWGARMTLVTEAYLHKFFRTYDKCVDCFLAPSRFVRDKFVEHGWNEKKFEILPHFQALSHNTDQSPDDAPILYFGRLSAEKGVEDLIRAMQYLPHIRLIVAGDGPERASLEQLSGALRLSNVHFAGHLRGEDLHRTITNSRFSVLPSHAYETLGKTILESYAHARAVIATDFGSRRELVRKGETGLLYEMGNVTQLKEAIEFLSARPDLAEEMGNAGQEEVRRSYTPEAHYASLIAIYERMAAAKKHFGTVWKRIETEAGPSSRGASGLAERIGKTWTAIPGMPPEPAPHANFLFPVATFNNRPLRIAFIGGRGLVSKYSGIETYYEEVGKRLAGVGHHVTVYCRTYFTPALREHNGMRIVRLPTIRSKHLETVLHTFLSTLHAITQPCDVVHYHALGPALFSFIPRLAGKKTMVTVQGLDWQRKKWGRLASIVLRLGERAAVRLPNVTMVVSRTLRQHYWDQHAAETTYVPNGGLLRDHRMPNKIFDWGLEPGNYILFLGRFSPEKGCRLLVEAYERLDTNVKLVMAGAASYCDAYTRELRTHASERIKLLDWVSGDALDELLTNAMLFVLPSDLEGLSLALLDAMGAGLCVLASDVPENREAVEDAGFTFRRGDAADLSERLQFLIANPTVREAAGEAARRRVQEEYQWNKIATQIEAAYFELTGRKPAAKKPSRSVQSAERTAQKKAG